MLEFVKLRQSHLEQVLAWRIRPEVTRYLFTDIENDLEKQKSWFQAIQKDRGCRHWVITCQKIPIGVANLSDIDEHHRRCSCGYYVAEAKYRLVGGMILPAVVNYVFSELNFEKITGKVMEGNKNALRLHDFHGYRNVGVLRRHILKYDTYHDVHLFEMLRDQWLSLEKHYCKFHFPFEQ